MKFLIQKEGERNWLSLDSSGTLQEGKYRIVAESDYRQQDVEICITYEGYTERSYQSDRQIYHRRSNDQGLIMVIPYTYLGPGNWEIRCHSDVMSDFLGEGWQETQQLTVIPLSSQTQPSNPHLESYKARLAELIKTEIEPFLLAQAEKGEEGEKGEAEVITIELADTATNSYRCFDFAIPHNSSAICLDLPQLEPVSSNLAFTPSLPSLPPKLAGKTANSPKKSPRLPSLPAR
ncbi:MAG: hypothetical protein N5P05_000249 [Chroococcopsis gigantea SAG 12.99]|jgi:hypothetical protein|nr:hypothetical protein [Chlorogloea purpurea SAG 13.99]MDV2998643.1 hypothetical protein [Chroococcopsis gigantea SAG 12.99]